MESYQKTNLSRIGIFKALICIKWVNHMEMKDNMVLPFHADPDFVDEKSETIPRLKVRTASVEVEGLVVEDFDARVQLI